MLICSARACKPLQILMYCFLGNAQIKFFDISLQYIQHWKDMMLQQMPNLLLIWQPWACCRSSSSCFGLVNWQDTWFSCGKFSKSNLSTCMAILQQNIGESYELMQIRLAMDKKNPYHEKLETKNKCIIIYHISYFYHIHTWLWFGPNTMLH